MDQNFIKELHRLASELPNITKIPISRQLYGHQLIKMGYKDRPGGEAIEANKKYAIPGSDYHYHLKKLKKALRSGGVQAVKTYVEEVKAIQVKNQQNTLKNEKL